MFQSFVLFLILGNLKSLKTTPEQKGVDVYGRLREFFVRNYTAQYMTLAVHSKRNILLTDLSLFPYHLMRAT